MIHVTTDAPKEQLEVHVDDEINAFDKWFRENIQDLPLVRSERAILKTYLGYKLKVKDEPAGTTAGVEASHGA